MSRQFHLFFILFFSALCLLPGNLSAEKVKVLSMHDSAKHPQGLLTHLATANANAPKGGVLRLGYVGTFNTTNPFVLKGTSPWGMNPLTETLVFERLMMRAPNEPFTMYAHIAEYADKANDNSQITFYLNPKARFADGTPVTIEDIRYSFESLREKGLANQRLVYKRIKEVKTDCNTAITFIFNPLEDGAYDPELPLIIANLTVLPKHFFEKREFDQTTFDPLLGSGPYRIIEVKAPKKIVYERNPDYWAKDNPISKGFYNFDRLEVNYYRDDDVARIAFGSGDYDIRIEENPTKWEKSYTFKAVQDGRIIKKELPDNSTKGMWGYAFNTRSPLFADIKVRQAISMLFPFEWINKNIYRGLYKRRNSYFQATDLSCQASPESAVNLPQLSPLNERATLKKAHELLIEAGYTLTGKQMVNAATGKPLEFELLLPHKEAEKVALIFANTLRKAGITMKIKVLDAAQMEQRRLQFSFDMILQQWLMSRSPGNEQKFYWSSPMANQAGSRNYIGIQSPEVDLLCTQVAKAKSRPELIKATRALDQKLLNGFYVIPLYYNPLHFVAYWDKFGLPPMDSDYGLSVMGIWHKDNKKDNNVSHE